MRVDDLILLNSIGKGSYGEVFLTTKEGSSEYYAAKRMDRAYFERPDNYKRLMNEISILKNIKHPNIVRLIDAKKTKTHCYIVTEYANGSDLYETLKKYNSKYHSPFSEEIVQHLMRQIVSAVNYLHSHKVVHRDLKLENILLNYSSDKDKNSLNLMKATAKIIDFGFATILHSSKANLTYTVLGTPCNMDPTLLKHFEQKVDNKYGYNEKVDIWSLGTLCYEMVTGHASFSGKTIEELNRNLQNGHYTLPLNLSKECASFINGMLQYNPEKRLTAEQLLNHDFLKKDIKQFTPIDKKKIQKKISGNGINIDIKKNQTIWKAFNEKNENQKKIVNNDDIIKQQKNNQIFYTQYEQPEYQFIENNYQPEVKKVKEPSHICAKVTVLTPEENKEYLKRQFTYNQPSKVFPLPKEGEQIIKQTNKKPKETKKEKDSDIFADIPMEYTYYGNGINFYQNK